MDTKTRDWIRAQARKLLHAARPEALEEALEEAYHKGAKAQHDPECWSEPSHPND